MSNWDFEEMGEFGSDADADRWAKRNNIAPQDVRIRRKGDGVELEVRRSALGDSSASSTATNVATIRAGCGSRRIVAIGSSAPVKNATADAIAACHGLTTSS